MPLIAEAFERVPAFRCLKVEVVPAGPKYTAVLEATGGRLHVSGGWAADQMIEALDRGVDVFMPTAMTGIYDKIFRAHEAGDRDTARRWFQRILPVLAFTRQHLDVSIHFYKRLYQHRGIFDTALTRQRTVGYDAYHALRRRADSTARRDRTGRRTLRLEETLHGRRRCGLAGDSGGKRRRLVNQSPERGGLHEIHAIAIALNRQCPLMAPS